MPVRALWGKPPPSGPRPNPSQLCDRVLHPFADAIEHDQGFTSPVLGFEVITRPDQRRLARVVWLLPPAQ